jgi:hypothetical protein
MAATIRNPDRTFLTASLDRFGIKNILFMPLFFIQRSRLATGHECPVFGRFDIQMVGTGIRLNSKNRPRFGIRMLTVPDNYVFFKSPLYE